MGVYIKGMEMPTNCSECAFCGYYGNGEHMCDIIQKAVEYESAKMSRLDDCPLVPVHPHGRLIDRDALKDAIGSTDWYHQAPSKDMVLGANSAEHQAWYKWQDINAAVYNAPTIIPADPVEVDNGT